MKSFLLLFMSVFFVANTKAQIGIGTTSPSAQLDITATNSSTPANTDGILIPRVAAFPVTNPTSSQNGMMVFLTTTSGSNLPGFYYWNNATSAWLGVGSANYWSLLGNAGTSSTTNFMGTTDDVDVVLKRNGFRAGYIGNPNTLSGNMNTAFGANSLKVATGTRNVAIGTNALPVNSTGTRNISIGDQSMVLNTIGTDNLAIGAGALYSNVNAVSNVAIGNNAMVSTTGGNNTAVGYFAMSGNTAGIYNTAIGREALKINSTGNYNVSLGYRAGYSTSALGSNNLFLGTNAGYNETGSSKLYIDNTTDQTATNNATTALIYGDFASSPKILRTNSQLQIGDPSGTGYKFPTARGTTGQVLETDGSGVISWADENTNLSIVRANLSGNQSLGTGGWQKITFDTAVFDTKSEFNTSSNRFVATKAGYYQINAGFHTNVKTGSTQLYSIGVYVNGALYQETAGNQPTSSIGIVSRNINCIVNLAVGGYVEIYVENYESSVNIDSYSGKSFFEVQQIK